MKPLEWYAVVVDGALWAYRRIESSGRFDQFQPTRQTMRGAFYGDKMRYYSPITR